MNVHNFHLQSVLTLFLILLGTWGCRRWALQGEATFQAAFPCAFGQGTASAGAGWAAELLVEVVEPDLLLSLATQQQESTQFTNKPLLAKEHCSHPDILSHPLSWNWDWFIFCYAYISEVEKMKLTDWFVNWLSSPKPQTGSLAELLTNSHQDHRSW